MGWVIEREVMAVYLAREDWAGLIGVATDGDDGLDGADSRTSIEVFRFVIRDIDADIRHGADGQWMNVARWF
jgi:hypothetical protein